MAHRVARERMARKRPGVPQVQRIGRTEVTTASARRDGAAAFLAMIQAGKQGRAVG